MSSLKTPTDKSAKASRKAKQQQWPYIRKRVYPNGSVGYIVDARTKTGGERKTFGTAGEAETFAQQCRIERENNGVAAFGNAELALYGKSPQDATQFMLEHLRSLSASKPVKTVVEAFIREKRFVEKRSERYLDDLDDRLGRFSSDFQDRMISSLTVEEITS